MANKKKKIVCIGGGTGTFTVLSGLKKYPVDLTAIVSMADSGGSNKVVRDEFGLLPTSDLRQCFVALAEDKNDPEKTLRELFNYRFRQGKGLKGMTFGNIFMIALTDILDSQLEGIKKIHQILRIKGKVLPVTLTDANLVAIYENGKKVVGEHLVDEPKHNGRLKIKEVYLQPEANAYPEAVKAILQADSVIIGPGDLYTSLLPNLLVKGIVEALRKSRAKKIFILNLMTKYGQTYGFSAEDHIHALENYLGKNCLDLVLMNSKSVPRYFLREYVKRNEFPVVDDLNDTYFRVIRRNLLNENITKKVAGDILVRSLIRHDPAKLAKVILSL